MELSANKKTRRVLAMCIVAVLLVFAVLSLPLVTFETTLFTKRSANTFVGDEKYLEAKAEVEAVCAKYDSDKLTVDESVTERTNSKGATTSMVTFTVRETVSRSGWALLAANFGHFEGMASVGVSNAVGIMALCLAVALILLLAASRKTLDVPRTALGLTTSRMYLAAGILALIALLMVPEFARSVTYTFSRRVNLLAGGRIQDDALLAGLSEFLFHGAAGEDLLALLGGLNIHVSKVIWVAFAAILVLLCGVVYLRYGELQKTLSRGGLYLFVIILCVFILYPFYVMFITAFRSNAETTDMYFLHMLPTQWVWSNLKDICDRGVLRFLLNSIILSTGATAIAMLCGIPAAYAMARMQFKGRGLFLGFVIMSQMFSPVVLLVGISQLMNTLHLNDTIIGLMLINAAFNQAFAIWLLRGTFVSISPEMEQAACIDGCTTVGALVKILLPMAAPGIVTTLIFVFINAWNEYTISTVLISTPTNKPITVGITQFSSFNMIEWQYLFAAALIATIPVIILFMCIEKHLAEGLTSGGVKG